MIEIKATENWQSAAFVVGKYITNDLLITTNVVLVKTKEKNYTGKNYSGIRVKPVHLSTPAKC